MKVIRIAAMSLLLVGCGKQLIATATDDALIIVSDVETTSLPEQRHALVHSSLALPPRDGDRSKMQQTERVAFDCKRHMSLSLSDVTYPIKRATDEVAVSGQWKATVPGTYGEDVIRVVCAPTKQDKPTIRPVRSIERDWRERVQARRAKASG
ncbi:hypothetical protein [Caulobacter sp. NIBR1757]|uniref:hypothetical protein n=1 Tax=Caulobacter sp. NIBR1757 TaxID=3016000 RepID=UPI0022F0CFBB|nr:hypothetical protein [Caulobacter sp. NIBR1757]WGM38890.1 hypothetical protein AMEJIAPC_01800 [Caulobacter sp. NIBR1757]